MQILISTLAIIICLICVVGIHELGHVIAAKLFGVKINSVSLGFGKAIYSWKHRSGCKINIGVWPVGGCVHLLNNRVSQAPDELQEYCFDKKPIWVRTIILLSGSLANIIMAFIALVFMLMLGFKQLPSIVETVTPESHAAISGIKPLDRISSVAGHKTAYWRDVSMQLIMHVGQKKVPITTCSNTNNCKNTTIDLNIWNNKTEKDFSMYRALGMMPMVGEQHSKQIAGSSFVESIVQGFSQLIGLICFFFVMLKQILTGSIPFAALLGPFKFFEAVIDSFSQGIATFLYFIGNFSLAMGIANLLPIPSLDGGSILYGFIEKVRGKPMSVPLELLIYRLISIAFAIFIVKLIVNDLNHYF
ncbi:MAG: site-2 protease family protein [Legionellaceae bacterium]|nr:site-2 protease family protein [Legionellaceae bacterium]